MDKVTTFEWISLAAILFGPIFAVLATRYLDDRKSDHQQRLSVFKTLMRTRRTPVVPDHVGALNLVEIEFANDQQVLSAWRILFTHFGTEHQPKAQERQDASLSEEENRNRQAQFLTRIATERQTLLAKLLHCMAKALGYKIEQLEIFEGGYTPQGWADDELEGRAVRRLFAEIALGKRPFPIGVFNNAAGSSVPPTNQQA
jgi:hypothetical protein